jgi:hypothetical protein
VIRRSRCWRKYVRRLTYYLRGTTPEPASCFVGPEPHSSESCIETLARIVDGPRTVSQGDGMFAQKGASFAAGVDV